MSSPRARGFSLIEILLVLAIIGILSGIAIPSFLGQRRRARVVGDAITNAKVLAISLESRKAENGTYGTAGIYKWSTVAGAPETTGPALIPTFVPQGNSKMNFSLAIGATGLTYTLTVTDPAMADAVAYQTDQSGAELARMK